ncbi:MAG: type II secretion system F family protein [Candidatus Omnitrophica bacterium]|nr:type II secretion system F family protein [Candidatus Omnitrophota bacterium]
MPKYIYRAKKSPTEMVEGTVMADNRNAAIQKLSQEGFFILSIDEYIHSVEAMKKTKRLIRGRVTLKDITYFTRQLADLVGSGLTIVRALEVVIDQTSNRRLRDVVADVRDSCVDGNPLSTALGRHPAVFSKLFISMVKSGEASGGLEEVLIRFAEFNEKQVEVRARTRSALVYPGLMVVVGIGTLTLLFTFVVPRIIGVFSDLNQSLPVPTKILLSIHSFFADYWSVILMGVAIVWIVGSNLIQTAEGKKKMDAVLISLPLIGGFIQKSEIARFSRVLATLLQSGIPLLEALGIVSGVMGNSVMQGEIDGATEMIKEGANLTRGFRDTKIFPVFALNMIAVGEESGHLEQSLFKVADTYERETDAQVKFMMSLIEPVMIITMGIIVGFVVIAMLLPIFEINFMIK